MAELGSLEVSLSLNAANFNGSISQVDRNLKAMGGELKAIQSRGAEYEKSIDGLTKKKDILSRSTQAASIKLQEQRKRYDELVASGKATEAQIERQALAVNKALAEYNKFERDLNQVTEELKSQSSQLMKTGQQIQELGGKLQVAGEKMKGVGQNLSSSLTLPLAGFGAIAGKAAMDFEGAQASIQTELGITKKEAEELGKTAEELWKNGFGTDLESVSLKVAGVTKSLGELSKVDLSYVTKGLEVFEKKGWADQQETLRAVKVLMEQFGMSSKDAMDYLTRGFQENLNFSGEFLDTVSEYSTYFKDLGFDADEMFARFKAGAEEGAFQLDKVGDAVKELWNRVTKEDKPSQEALQKLGLNASKLKDEFAAGGDTAQTAFQDVVKALMSVDDQQLRNQLSTELFGTQYEDLGSKAFEAMLTAEKGLSNVAGATGKTSEVLERTFGQRLQGTMRDAQSAFEPLGSVMLDLAEDWLPKIRVGVEKLSGWFSDLSPNMQTAVVGFGALTAVAGPSLMLIGSMSSGIGLLAKGVGLLTPALGGATLGATGFGSALGVISGPVGWAALGVAAIGTAAVVTAKEMSESSIQVDLWGEGVSEATQKAVGGFLELDEQATIALNQLNWSGQTVTAEMATKIAETFAQMGDQVLAAMQEDHAEQLETMQSYFANSAALTEQEEAEILANMQAKQAEKELVITDGEARIEEILLTAKNNRRGITETEQQEINQIQQTMKDNAIQYLTENEMEQKVILERLKTESSKITAEQAAEVVANSVKQKDEVIKEANDQYSKTVAEIIKQRDETGVISADQATKLIADAKKTRDDTVKNAQDMHTNVVTEAKNQATEHVDQVNWETGEVLSKWEVFKGDFKKKVEEIKIESSKKWEEISKDTSEKLDKIKGLPAKKLEEMKVAVEKKMGEVKVKIESKWEEAEKFLEGVDLLQIGKDIVSGLVSGIGAKFESVRTKIEELARLIPDWAKDMLGIQSPSKIMADEVGKWIPLGIAAGIDKYIGSVETSMSGVLKIVESSNRKINDLNSRQKSQLMDIEKKVQNERLSSLEQFIAKEYKLEKIGIQDEIALWEYAVKNFNLSAEDQRLATLKLRDAKLTMYDDIKDAGEQYIKDMETINNNMLTQEKALTTEYENAVSNRARTLYSFVGIFDEIQTKTEVTGRQLISNLQGQVSTFRDWASNIATLASKGIDDGLLQELRDMGPKAAAEIAALNSLTEDELKEYNALWLEKNELAKTQAVSELEGLKLETETKIAELHNKTAEQLEGLRLEWIGKMEGITKGTTDEMDILTRSMPQIGNDIIGGLIVGLDAKTGELMLKAQDIADSIRKTIQSALDINSPSRVMRGFGVNIGEGLILGMNDMTEQVAVAAERLSLSASGGFTGNTTNYDNSTTYKPTIKVSTGVGSKDIAREIDRTLRRAAFGAK